jgi:hypothetical protein
LFAVSLGDDVLQTRALLALAQGYAVVDRDGKRIGAFIEIVDEGQIAVRHDGTFVWRRRLLPIGTVAKVLPEQRAVVLTVDRQAIVRSGRTWAEQTDSEPARRAVPDWKERLTHYAPVEQHPPSPESEPTEHRGFDRHLLFIATSSGYLLFEREGPPPPLGSIVEVPEQPVPFGVIKVGSSPLPGDARSCAYLEPTR